ncbi:MAG: AMP-binding protein [Cytophagales bacterium]|nr:AMP-binding protein [Bernardetiaceae bacterium]MDW8209519.1 AMP-binding protein [Cytophagales bacterium]
MLLLADLPEQPVWTATHLLHAEPAEWENYPEAHQMALQFSQAWLRGTNAFCIPTSGSTGIPKSINLSRQQIIASIKASTTALCLQQGQSALVCLHPRYIAGIMMLARGWELGWQMYFVAPSANPLGLFVRQSWAKGFDFLALVPLQLQNTLENEPEKQLLDRCGIVLVGGAALSAVLERATRQVKPAIYATFGMTETASHIALRRLNGPHPEADYYLLPGIEAHADQRSCLVVRGEVTQHQWIVTNDVVQFTGNNRFKFLGRADWVINSGGVKIFPEQIEQHIHSLQLSFLKEKRFIIASLPDERLGSCAVLAIETESVPDKKNLLAVLRNKLPRYHAPRDIFCLPQFPTTPTGKISRKDIQQMLIRLSQSS